MEQTDLSSIRLVQMTDEMYEDYFKEFENDPDLFSDRSRFVPYEYSEETVARYIRRLNDLHRIPLAILCGEEIVGEIVLKNIEARKCATMGICLKSDAYKNRGIGTQAERLAAAYVFSELNIPVLYADTLRTNTRSQRVLEKAGFSFIREDGNFRYYRICRDASPSERADD